MQNYENQVLLNKFVEISRGKQLSVGVHNINSKKALHQ